MKQNPMNPSQHDKKTKKSSRPSKPVSQAADKKKNLGISARDGNKLQALIRVAARHGVSFLKVGDMQVHFGPTPPTPPGAIGLRDVDDMRGQDLVLPEDELAPNGIIDEVRATVAPYSRWRNKPNAADTNPFEE